jgi:hypothetical protein
MNAPSDKAAELFLATDLTQGEVAPDQTESLSIIRGPLNEARYAAVTGKIRDVVTVAALLQMTLNSLDAVSRPDGAELGNEPRPTKSNEWSSLTQYISYTQDIVLVHQCHLILNS